MLDLIWLLQGKQEQNDDTLLKEVNEMLEWMHSQIVHSPGVGFHIECTLSNSYAVVACVLSYSVDAYFLSALS